MQGSSRSRDETDFSTRDSTPVARFGIERDLDDEEGSKQEGLEEFTLRKRVERERIAQKELAFQEAFREVHIHVRASLIDQDSVLTFNLSVSRKQ
jgi:hypothetical protein